MNTQKELNAINMMSVKSEKIKWNRSHDKMQKLLSDLRPIEDKILQLQMEKQPIMDHIELIRIEMVDMCIHPKELLIHNGNHIECKFCNKKLSIPTMKREPNGIQKI